MSNKKKQSSKEYVIYFSFGNIEIILSSFQ